MVICEAAAAVGMSAWYHMHSYHLQGSRQVPNFVLASVAGLTSWGNLIMHSVASNTSKCQRVAEGHTHEAHAEALRLSQGLHCYVVGTVPGFMPQPWWSPPGPPGPLGPPGPQAHRPNGVQVAVGQPAAMMHPQPGMPYPSPALGYRGV